MSFRSFLFVPGDSARKLQKAMTADTAVVIVDLEDAVAPAAKDSARKNVVEILARSAAAAPAIAVRVNAQDTSWYRDDLLSVILAKPDYIMLPKCRSVDDLMRLDHEISLLERAHRIDFGHIRLLPLVTENAMSVTQLDYRNAPGRTAALCFAAEDLASEMGISPRDAQGRLAPALQQARIATAFAARTAGLPAIDTPFPDPQREDLLQIEAEDALQSGYAGKLCIHPNQIAVVEAIFTPTPEKLQWADAVIAALSDNETGGVALVDGHMVDRAHLRLARDLKDRAD